MFASQKDGLSALSLQRALEIGSYPTAWAMLHRLRSVLVRPGRDRLTGTVEVDETFVGGEEQGLRGGRAKGKKALVGVAVELREPRGVRPGAEGDSGRWSAKTHAFVTEHIEPGTRVIGRRSSPRSAAERTAAAAWSRPKVALSDVNPYLTNDRGAPLIRRFFTAFRGSNVYLGEEFHLNRAQITALQIGGLPNGLTGRWTVERLHEVLMRLAQGGLVDVGRLVSHVVPVAAAAAAFKLLDERPAAALQVVLDFRDRSGSHGGMAKGVA